MVSGDSLGSLTPLEAQATVLRPKPFCDPSQDDKVGRDKGRRCQDGRRNSASALVVSINVRSRWTPGHALHIERLVQGRVLA